MTIDIKHHSTGEVLYTSTTATTTVEAVVEAVEDGANFAGADLARTNFAGAYLAYANFADADLTGADLAGADLTGAYLAGAEGMAAAADSPPLEIPVIPRIHGALLAAVTAAGNRLDMSQWHACDTTHCRAGWIVTLAGEGGKALEEKLGTARAASLIYRASDPGFRVPHWYASTERALADIRACAQREAAAIGGEGEK